MLVHVRPLPPKGRNKFTVLPNTRKVYGVGLHPVTGKIITGLTEEKEKELSEILGWDLKPHSKFWHDYSVVLNEHGTVLDLSDPVQELQYRVLLTKTEVANSPDEIKPYSVYVMYNEEIEAEKANKSFDYELSAYSYIKEMSEEERANFLKLFGFRTRNMSPSIIKKTLKDRADKDPKGFVELYEDKNKTIKILIEDCIHNGVITVKNGAYYFGEDMLGADINLAIAKIKAPKSSDLRLAIEHNLQKSTSVI